MSTRVTTTLEAKNEVSPELVKVRRDSENARKSFGGWSGDWKRAGSAARRETESMHREMEQMRREVHQLRGDLQRLGSVRASPTISVDDQATRDISAIEQRLQAVKDVALGIVIGSALDGMNDSLINQARERVYMGAKGTSEADQHRMEATATKISTKVNPYIEGASALEIVNRSNHLFGRAGDSFAEVTAQLDYLTRAFKHDKTPEVMKAISDAFGVADATRIGNTLMYIEKYGKDLMGDEMPDSLREYSVQMSKVFGTPEQLGEYVRQVSKMSVFNPDVAFDAPKEALLKLTNQGDLLNILKTGYELDGMKTDDAAKIAAKNSMKITELINSNNAQDNREALGILMMDIASIKDNAVRNNMIMELGGGPGENFGPEFKDALFAAGAIATNQIAPGVSSTELSDAYKGGRSADFYFETKRAWSEINTAAIGGAKAISQDLAPVMSYLSEVTNDAAAFLASIPTEVRQGLEIAAFAAAGTGLVISSGMQLGAAIMQLRAAKKLEEAAEQLEGSGGGPDLDRDGNKGGKRKGGKWNPMNWFSKEKEPPPKKYMSSEEAKRQALGYGGPSNSKADEPVKKSLKEKMSDAFTKENLNKTWGDTKKFGREVLESFIDVGGVKEMAESAGKGLMKRLPMIGSIAGIAGALAAADPMDSLMQLGAGSAGGILASMGAGAAMGSILPGAGTLVGGTVGLGAGVIGTLSGEAIYSQIKEWWSKAPPPPPPPRPPEPVRPAGPPVPVVPASPVKQEKPKPVNVKVDAIPITLKAEGILQDVASLLKMLRDPSVTAEVKRIIEKALIDAIETKGGTT